MTRPLIALTAGTVAGLVLVGGSGYLLLMYGPDLSSSHFAFLTKGP